MGKRVLYVGGLSDSVSDCNLRDLFGAYGLVARAHVVRYKHSGKSAGYGFVEMASDEQAHKAVVALEGTRYDGIAYGSMSRPISQAVPNQFHPLTRDPSPAAPTSIRPYIPDA